MRPGPRAEVRGFVPRAQEAERVLLDSRLEFQQRELVCLVPGAGGYSWRYEPKCLQQKEDELYRHGL